MKKFLIIWAGDLISSIGSGMTAFALSVYVYSMTKNVSTVSLITLLAFLPTILLSPLGGVLADRYDRRLLMVIGDLLSGLGVLYILIYIRQGFTSLLPVYTGVFISSIFVSLIEPSYKAGISDLLTKDEFAKANSLMQIASGSKYLISPVLAGFLLKYFDISLILAIDIGTVFITSACTMFVRSKIGFNKKQSEKSMFSEFKEGCVYIVRHKELRALIIVMTAVCFFAGFIQILSKPIILAFGDSKTLGMAESLSSIGLLLGSVFIGITGIKKNYRTVLMTAGIICGMGMLSFGFSKSFISLAASMFVVFFSLPFINTCADVLARVSISNELQGRIWGLIGLISQMGMILAYACSGFLADRVFEPLVAGEGRYSLLIRNIIGSGAGRGSALLLVISGLGMAAIAIYIGNNKYLKISQIRAEEINVQKAFVK